MSPFLHSKPKTEKKNEQGEGTDFTYAIASMQGWRSSMEDAHHIQVPLSHQPPFNEWSFFAVFDGHAGKRTALIAAEQLLQSVLETDEFQELTNLLKKNTGRIEAKALRLIRRGLRDGFLEFDVKARKECGENEPSGTTALCAFITPEFIIFANCGDSRGILSRKNSRLVSTKDHKPTEEHEKERIQKAGGGVYLERVNGSLAFSRSLGDYDYKKDSRLSPVDQLVSPQPDIYVIERDKSDDEFIILACDGIYDVFDNEELVSLVRSRLSATDDLVYATNQILDISLSKGSQDNMTMILIVLEAAPRRSDEAVEWERAWLESIESKMPELCSRLDHVGVPCMEDSILKKVLANEGLDNGPPGGLHLARLLIDQYLHAVPKLNVQSMV
ncbi:Protein phosphatase 2C containing protein [Aphelenchoides avenae]|nr:Protein phosphatase 2C containing protein [Aphelenchus avenae]